MRKYYWILKNELQRILEYRFNFISSFLFSFVPLGVNTLLWLAVAKQDDSFLMSINEIISYYWVVLISVNLTEANIALQISKDIRLGELNKYLIKPCNYSLYHLARDIPSRLLFLLMNVIPMTIIFLLLNQYLVFKLTVFKLIAYLILIVLGYLINYLIDLLIGYYSFYFSKINYFYSTIKVFRNIMAGSIFPLNLLPIKWFSVLSFLPFSYVVFFPSSIILTDSYYDNILTVFLGSLIWCIVLATLCTVLWRRGVQRYSSFGG